MLAFYEDSELSCPPWRMQVRHSVVYLLSAAGNCSHSRRCLATRKVHTSPPWHYLKYFPIRFSIASAGIILAYPLFLVQGVKILLLKSVLIHSCFVRVCEGWHMAQHATWRSEDSFRRWSLSSAWLEMRLVLVTVCLTSSLVCFWGRCLYPFHPGAWDYRGTHSGTKLYVGSAHKFRPVSWWGKCFTHWAIGPAQEIYFNTCF